MSRARNIKPGFFKNEALAECEPMARLMFVGLWTLADRNGNLENRPKRLKGELFPYDNCDPAALLAQLVGHGLVVPYEAEGISLLNIPAFKAHQNPHMAEKPKYPEPSASPGPAPGQHGANPADSLLLNPSSLNPDSLSSAPSGRARELDAEALAEVCQLDLKRLTHGERGRFNKALKGLRSVQATPDSIRARAVVYRRLFADCSLTPTGLEANWGKCDPSPPLPAADQAKADATRKLVEESQALAKAERDRKLGLNA